MTDIERAEARRHLDSATKACVFTMDADGNLSLAIYGDMERSLIALASVEFAEVARRGAVNPPEDE